MRFMRLIDLLGEDNRIKVIVSEYETVYYYKVGREEKLQELLRVKTDEEQRKRLEKKKVEKEVKAKMEKEGKSLSDAKYKDEF